MLYLIATPIGNLADITLRAIETLRNVDYVASEDTRKTGRLLKHYDIKKPQLSFHEHNERRAGPRIIALLKTGKSVALVTSAGTPAISDPGFTLVRSAVQADLEVTMIPGPCSLIMAAVLYNLPIHCFTFRGFAPRKPTQRRKFLSADKLSAYTLIYYESPFRLHAFLEDALQIFGDRNAALAHELTKIHESITRATISQILESLPQNPKGEHAIIIAPA